MFYNKQKNIYPSLKTAREALFTQLTFTIVKRHQKFNERVKKKIKVKGKCVNTHNEHATNIKWNMYIFLRQQPVLIGYELAGEDLPLIYTRKFK